MTEVVGVDIGGTKTSAGMVDRAGTVRGVVIAEGRIRTPADAAEALRRGAHAVVVGTAITHLTTITAGFAAALHGRAGR